MSQTSPAPAWVRGLGSGRVLAAGVALLLLSEIVLAQTAVRFAPPGSSVAAYWPNSGISVAALILTLPRWRPLTLAGILVVSVLGNLAGERGLQVSAGFGVANLGEAALAIWLLAYAGGGVSPSLDEERSGHQGHAGPLPQALPNAADADVLPHRPRLDTVDDFIRLFVACAFAALLGGVLAGASVGLLEDGDGLLSARTVFASHLAAMLLIVPLALRLPRDPGLNAGRLEVAAQWVTLTLVIVAVFFGARTLPLVFILYPILVWGALRFQPWLTALQLLVAGGAVSVLTTVRGGPYLSTIVESGQPPELSGALLQAHLLATALVTLPLALMRSQRLHVLDDLTRSHEELDAILAATTATAIVGIGNGGRVEYVNVGGERLTGYSAADVVRVAHVTLLEATGAEPVIGFSLDPHHDDGGAWRALVDPQLGGHGAAVQDWVLERADGRHITVSVALSRRLDPTGTPVGYLAVAEDVTDRRQQERAMQEALASEKLAVDRLAQLDQTKNDFLATVSHELRTPITSILGYSQLLMGQDAGDLPAMHQQVVGRIERNGRRLMGLIEDMLAMSQIEVGSFGFSRAPLDLREPLAQAVESTLPLLPARDLELVQDTPEGPVLVAGDPDKLERAFANLLSNAVKFSNPGEQVAVRLCAHGDEAVFSVTDTGIGIHARDQEQLFERFFRGAEAHTLAIQGAGLGLSIAATIVQGHDGRIDIDSAPGQGSTFTIRLPLLVEAP